MAALKIVFGVFLASLLGALVASKSVKSNESSASVRAILHNINKCINPTAKKTLLYKENVIKDASYLNWKNVTVNFPKSGTNSQLITCITVFDQYTDGKGGHPSIVSGGINSTAVEILLESQWNCGMNFEIKIWADA